MTLIEYFALNNTQLETLLTTAVSNYELTEECKAAIIEQRDTVKANLELFGYTDDDLPDYVKNTRDPNA